MLHFEHMARGGNRLSNINKRLVILYKQESVFYFVYSYIYTMTMLHVEL